MELLRWGIFVLCFLVAIYILAMNYWSVYTNYKYKKSGIDKHVSLVPFVSSVFALIATMFSPIAILQSGIGLFGVIVILDVGTSGILTMLIYSGMRFLLGRSRT